MEPGQAYNRQVEVRMSSGTEDKMKGRIKEAAGALVGDNGLKQAGKADQLAGKVKDIAEMVADTQGRREGTLSPVSVPRRSR